MPQAPDRVINRQVSGERRERGFSVLETLIAAFILIVLGTAIVTTGLKSRTQIDHEEVRRRAIALAQERLETVRATIPYDSLTATRISDAVTVDGTTFTHRGGVIGGIVADPTVDDAKSIADTVSWTATGGGNSITRRVIMHTIVFRGI